MKNIPTYIFLFFLYSALSFGFPKITPNPPGKNVKAAILYCKAADDHFMASDSVYSDSTRCGVAQWPADSLKPNWFGQLLIPTPFDSASVAADTASYPFSITTYFYRMSNGALWLYGDEYFYAGPAVHKTGNVSAFKADNQAIHEWFLNNTDNATLASYDNDKDGFIDLLMLVDRVPRFKTNYQGVAVGIGYYLPSTVTEISASDSTKVKFKNSASLEDHSGVYQNQVWSLGERNIITHEIGHQLRRKGHLNGLHRWNLMSGAGFSGGRAPSESGLVMSAWERHELGWLEFEDILVDRTQFALPGLTASGKAIRIPFGENNFFILENRHNEMGFENIPNPDCGYLTSELAEGLLLSKSINGNQPKIIPADGEISMQNHKADGDASDLFSQAGVTSITPYTFPNTNHRKHVTHKAITDIHYSGDTLIFNIYQNYWGDSIRVDTRWHAEKSPYFVGENLTVLPGVRLTIAPGTTVRFAQDAVMTIEANAQLIANGTATDSIRFERADAFFEWNYLNLKSEENAFSHCFFEGEFGLDGD